MATRYTHDSNGSNGQHHEFPRLAPASAVSPNMSMAINRGCFHQMVSYLPISTIIYHYHWYQMVVFYQYLLLHRGGHPKLLLVTRASPAFGQANHLRWAAIPLSQWQVPTSMRFFTRKCTTTAALRYSDDLWGWNSIGDEGAARSPVGEHAAAA